MVGPIVENSWGNDLLYLMTETDGYNVLYDILEIGKTLRFTSAEEVIRYDQGVYAKMDPHTLLIYIFGRDHYYLYHNEDVEVQIKQNPYGEVYFTLDDETVFLVDIKRQSEEIPLD